MKRKITIDVACSNPNTLGESPIWSVRDNALYWVDIAQGHIHRLGQSGDHRAWNVGGRVGAVGLRSDGGLIATMPDGIYTIGPQELEHESPTLVPVARPELADGVRLKEGKVDPAGRYWCGSTGRTREERAGGLFRLGPDGELHKVDDGFMLVNGIAFHQDGRTMMMADSPDDIVYRYELERSTGKILSRRPFFSTADFPGVVDGATFDSDGGFWCAMIYDGAVGRIDADGRLDRLIRLPVQSPTMCAFGGPNLDLLYVTTSTTHMSEAERLTQPLAGQLLVVDGLGARGLPEPVFG
jgi:sugar lactone lactonase YvrE